MKIIADNKIPYLKGVFEAIATVEYCPGADINSQIVKDADALITRTRTKCNIDLLTDSSIKMIASATIGFDHIDTTFCDANNIQWTNAPGCNSGSVKQYISAVLGLLVEEKEWTLIGKRIAVVGVGNVGSKVSALCKALGMEVYEIDPPRAKAETDKPFYNLQDVIHKMDIITFHTPLTREGSDKTYHLCDESLLKKMKPSCVVINTSRGEVVDGQALKKALTNQEIELAVLDVWEHEPEFDHELLELVWIATPHIAGYSQDGKANGTQMSVQAISKKFNLGMDDWQPGDLRQPQFPELIIDCKYLTIDEIAANAFLHTYDLRADDQRLRNSPTTFEKQRGDYPVRREFRAYHIQLENGILQYEKLLQAVGFENVTTI